MAAAGSGEQMLSGRASPSSAQAGAGENAAQLAVTAATQRPLDDGARRCIEHLDYIDARFLSNFIHEFCDDRPCNRPLDGATVTHGEVQQLTFRSVTSRSASDDVQLASAGRVPADGDRTARDRVIEQNLPLVHAIARRFSRRAPTRSTTSSRSAPSGSSRRSTASPSSAAAISGRMRSRRSSASSALRRRAVVARSTSARAARPPSARRVAVPLDDGRLRGRGGGEPRSSGPRSGCSCMPGSAPSAAASVASIVLRYYRDWSQERIAPSSASRSRRSRASSRRALRKLRDELAPDRGKHCASRHT